MWAIQSFSFALHSISWRVQVYDDRMKDSFLLRVSFVFESSRLVILRIEISHLSRRERATLTVKFKVGDSNKVEDNCFYCSWFSILQNSNNWQRSESSLEWDIRSCSRWCRWTTFEVREEREEGGGGREGRNPLCRIECFDEDRGQDEELGRLNVPLAHIRDKGKMDKVSEKERDLSLIFILFSGSLSKDANTEIFISKHPGSHYQMIHPIWRRFVIYLSIPFDLWSLLFRRNGRQNGYRQTNQFILLFFSYSSITSLISLYVYTLFNC